MSDSNKNVVKSAQKEMVSNSGDEEKCFDFPALPYVCQKRLAEILDPKTLKTFSSINTTTKNLSKRCHIIENAEIRNESLSFSSHCIKLDDLKMIMPPGLKGMQFYGGIESDCSLKEFMDFIKSLTQLDDFDFTLIHEFSSLSFNIVDLASEGAELLSQKVITNFEAHDNFTFFDKI